MKIWIRYLLFFSGGLFVFITLISMSKNPESTIIGEWAEQEWKYEKVDKNENSTLGFNSISTYVKQMIGENLIIHKAESWKFLPNGKLILKGDSYTKEVSWCMKGRGNILEIKHNNQQIEHYNVTELTSESMTLNFDTDVHTRGIAKLTFNKKIKNAKKI